MPRFSIVMPTRNRGQLLQYALQSALDQPTADLEIVVSDNDSHDDTPAVARRFRDPRLRYVRTPETLAMPDSWEFALSHATGDYVTFLCDDDAFSPRLLSAVDASAAVWRSCAGGVRPTCTRPGTCRSSATSCNTRGPPAG